MRIGAGTPHRELSGRCGGGDLDIGHTDPQLVLPYGGRVRVDGLARRITAVH